MKAITSEGGAILIELTDEPEVFGTSAEGTAGVEDLVNKLDQIAETIANVCSSLHTRAYSTLGKKRPNAFELEFGVSLAGEAGVPLVTRGAAECTIKVIARWES